jgi:hypothetical protein
LRGFRVRRRGRPELYSEIMEDLRENIAFVK